MISNTNDILSSLSRLQMQFTFDQALIERFVGQSMKELLKKDEDLHPNISILKNTPEFLNYYYILTHFKQLYDHTFLINENVFLSKDSKNQFSILSNKFTSIMQGLETNTLSITTVKDTCQKIAKQCVAIFSPYRAVSFHDLWTNTLKQMKVSITAIEKMVKSDLNFEVIKENRKKAAAILNKFESVRTIAELNETFKQIYSLRGLAYGIIDNFASPTRKHFKSICEQFTTILILIGFLKLALVGFKYSMIFSALLYSKSPEEISMILDFEALISDNQVIYLQHSEIGKIQFTKSNITDIQFSQFIGCFQGLIELDDTSPNPSLESYLQSKKFELIGKSTITLQILTDIVGHIIEYLNTFNATPYIAMFYHNLFKLKKLMMVLALMAKDNAIDYTNVFVREILIFYNCSFAITSGNVSEDVFILILEASRRINTFITAQKPKMKLINNIIDLILDTSQIISPILPLIDSISKIIDLIQSNAFSFPYPSFNYPSLEISLELGQNNSFKKSIDNMSVDFITCLATEIEAYGIKIIDPTYSNISPTSLIIPNIKNIINEMSAILSQVSNQYPQLFYLEEKISTKPLDFYQILHSFSILDTVIMSAPQTDQKLQQLNSLLEILYSLHQLYLYCDVIGISSYSILVHLTFLNSKNSIISENKEIDKHLIQNDPSMCLSEFINTLCSQTDAKTEITRVKISSDIKMEPLKLLQISFNHPELTQEIILALNVVNDILTFTDPSSKLDQLSQVRENTEMLPIVNDLIEIVRKIKKLNSGRIPTGYIEELAKSLKSQVAPTKFYIDFNTKLSMKSVELQIIFEIMKTKELFISYDDSLFIDTDFSESFVQNYYKFKIINVSGILDSLINSVTSQVVIDFIKSMKLGRLTYSNLYQLLILTFQNCHDLPVEKQAQYVDCFEKLYIIISFANLFDEVFNIIMNEQRNMNIFPKLMVRSININLIADYFVSHFLLFNSQGFIREKYSKLLLDASLANKRFSDEEKLNHLISVWDKIISEGGIKLDAIFQKIQAVSQAIVATEQADSSFLDQIKRIKTINDYNAIEEVASFIQRSEIFDCDQRTHLLYYFQALQNISKFIQLKRQITIHQTIQECNGEVDIKYYTVTQKMPTLYYNQNVPRPAIKVPLNLLLANQQSTIASIYTNLRDERKKMLSQMAELIKNSSEKESKQKILDELSSQRQKLADDVIKISKEIVSLNQHKIEEYVNLIMKTGNRETQKDESTKVKLRELLHLTELHSVHRTLAERDCMGLHFKLMNIIKEADNSSFASTRKSNKDNSKDSISAMIDKSFSSRILADIEADKDAKNLSEALHKIGIL